MVGMNLQTSFLTPPFGFALFYLRGVAPPEVTTWQIYRGAIPFIVIQAIGLIAMILYPELVTWAL
jgi:TRAP-type mannitol/chloroaromatic compound transport system permease large subunit